MTDGTTGGGSAPSDPLERAASARRRALDAVDRSAPTNGRYLVLFGALFGVLTLAVGLTAHRTPVGLILSMSAFVVCLQLLVARKESTKTAAGRGWSRRAGVAAAVTGGLYVCSVLIATFEVVGQSLGFWALAGLLVAAPAVLRGLQEMRRLA